MNGGADMTDKKDSKNPYEMTQEEYLSGWSFKILKFILFCFVARLWWVGVKATMGW